jgi:hypothetical protein
MVSDQRKDVILVGWHQTPYGSEISKPTTGWRGRRCRSLMHGGKWLNRSFKGDRREVKSSPLCYNVVNEDITPSYMCPSLIYHSLNYSGSRIFATSSHTKRHLGKVTVENTRTSLVTVTWYSWCMVTNLIYLYKFTDYSKYFALTNSTTQSGLCLFSHYNLFDS